MIGPVLPVVMGVQIKKNIRDVAAGLGVELGGKTQEELWAEIVRRIMSKGEDVSRELPSRRRESPPFRWIVPKTSVARTPRS